MSVVQWFAIAVGLIAIIFFVVVWIKLVEIKKDLTSKIKKTEEISRKLISMISEISKANNKEPRE